MKTLQLHWILSAEIPSYSWKVQPLFFQRKWTLRDSMFTPWFTFPVIQNMINISCPQNILHFQVGCRNTRKEARNSISPYTHKSKTKNTTVKFFDDRSPMVSTKSRQGYIICREPLIFRKETSVRFLKLYVCLLGSDGLPKSGVSGKKGSKREKEQIQHKINVFSTCRLFLQKIGSPTKRFMAYFLT